MIKVKEETLTASGPWGMEFGCYERVGLGEISEEECWIIDGSSPKLWILKCKLANIHPDRVNSGFFYKIERENGDEETWHYSGRSRINPEFVTFSRPYN